MKPVEKTASPIKMLKQVNSYFKKDIISPSLPHPLSLPPLTCSSPMIHLVLPQLHFTPPSALFLSSTPEFMQSGLSGSRALALVGKAVLELTQTIIDIRLS